MENVEYAPLQEIEDIVLVENGKMFTTSQIVSKLFEKNHFDVLKAIKNLECSQVFNDSNFTAVEYTDAKGERRPAFTITRDGFAFLAMGFTGSKAAAWKEKFLEAFNSMERELLNAKKEVPVASISTMQRPVPKIVSADLRKKCTKRQVELLEDFITFWCHVEGCSREEASQFVLNSLRIPALEELQQANVGATTNFIWSTTFQRASYSGEPATEASTKVLHALMRIIEHLGGYKPKDIEHYICLTCKTHSLDDLTEKDMQKAIWAAFMCFISHREQ